MQRNAVVTIHGSDQPDPAFAPTALIPRPVLLYSATCRFCRWAARVVATLDRREQLALLPVATEEASRLLAAVSEDKRTATWWFVRRDGTAVAGHNGGAVVLLREIQLTEWIARVIVLAGMSPLVNCLEALVARHRRTLSRFVPEGPALTRFP
jgi:predicted DCC family thiol-disulfide oxidoreductase YuxK